MTRSLRTLTSGVPRPSLRSVLGAPVRLQTYRNLLYLLLAFPLGIAYFVYVVVGVSVSASLTILLVGIPLFLLVLVGGLLVAAVERRLTAVLLGVDVPAPADGWAFRDAEGPLAAAKLLVTDPAAWLALGYLVSKFAIGIAAFVLQVTLLVTCGTFVAVPLFYDRPGVDIGVMTGVEPTTIPFSLYLPWQDLLVGVEFVFRLTEWEVDTLPEALLMSAVGVAGLVVSLNVLNGFAWLTGQYTRLMLGTHDVGWERVGAAFR